jgi:hypothetical protein
MRTWNCAAVDVGIGAVLQLIRREHLSLECSGHADVSEDAGAEQRCCDAWPSSVRPVVPFPWHGEADRGQGKAPPRGARAGSRLRRRGRIGTDPLSDHDAALPALDLRSIASRSFARDDQPIADASTKEPATTDCRAGSPECRPQGDEGRDQPGACRNCEYEKARRGEPGGPSWRSGGAPRLRD